MGNKENPHRGSRFGSGFKTFGKLNAKSQETEQNEQEKGAQEANQEVDPTKFQEAASKNGGEGAGAVTDSLYN